jgi:eukaryotic-like serine/threonine-protein kinase
MSLTPGTLVGCYEIVSMIGAGGMGEVYRARDTKLNRDVAIKVLPDLFTEDPDRFARFTREAQTLAALNHPNIAHVHGLEESPSGSGRAGVRALVMELVEGEDLSAVIARGPIPLAEALAVARQIADALEAAHEQGIVHRDLKPANIKLRGDGTVKVLDFGLAKAMDPVGQSGPDAMNSPTLTVRGTQMGIIVGTAAYMAPEQARGKTVDRRADIWAFGVVLFEMLTGDQAFKGDDISEVLATVLKSDPDWRALPPEMPGAIKRLLRRCLEKDPRKRLSAISDARLELDESDPAPGAIVDALGLSRRRSIGMNAALGLVALTILATVGAMIFLDHAPAASGSGPLARLSIVLPDGDEVVDTSLRPLAISPDGTRVAYVALRDGVQRLFLRTLADATPLALAGTEGAHCPFFSPDGQWIGFFAQGKVKKAAVGGAAVQVIADGAPDARGGTWTRDGTIYFAPTNVSGLWKVPASGGTATEFTQLDVARGEISHRWPEAPPDGETLLFSSWTGPGPDERSVVAVNLNTAARRELVPGGEAARYLSPGYLAYSRLDALLALRWTPSLPKPADAAPVSLPEFARMENEGGADYAVSTTGTLAYVAGGAARYAQRIVWVDRVSGAAEALPLPERDYEGIKLSPDGQRAIVQIREGAIGLWLYDFTRHTLTPFATAGGSSQAPAWTPDGRRIVYRGTRSGTRNLYWRSADGTGEEQRLTTKPGVIHTPGSVSPDGRWVVFTEQGGGQLRGASLWATRLEAGASPGSGRAEPADGSAPRKLVEGANGQISPNGRWLAYQSVTSGQLDVYVVPFPDSGPRIPISVNGGGDPLWSRDGRELFYTSGDQLVAVAVTSGATLAVGAPRVLYEGRYRPGPNAVTAFSVAPDGRRFLRVQQVQPDRPVTRIEIVLNWVTQLQGVAAGK